MTTVVVMPGGFHPFHAGHMALYNSARRVFPDAEVYVAATNDTSSRPFPFAIKEKLAGLAGVEPGHFVQVKSPFRAEEITAKFDPNKDQLIFVRSEKDQGSQPKPGGVKKDGSPSYLQPLLGAKKLEPFAKHAYMAYLPTVEFGPGMTSATQIRAAWPGLDERRKTALVMSLYPATQSNPKLAATVRKMLDTAIVGDSVEEDISRRGFLKGAGAAAAAGASGSAGAIGLSVPIPVHTDSDPPLKRTVKAIWNYHGSFKDLSQKDIMAITQAVYVLYLSRMAGETYNGKIQGDSTATNVYEKAYALLTAINDNYVDVDIGKSMNLIKQKLESMQQTEPEKFSSLQQNILANWHTLLRGARELQINGPTGKNNSEEQKRIENLKRIQRSAASNGTDVKEETFDENQGWAATYTNEETRAYGGQQGAGMTAAYQRRENQPVDERKKESETTPAEYRRDPELYKLRQYAKQHYGQYADNPEMAIMKLLQRGLEHSEVNDQVHDQKLRALAREIQTLRSEIRQKQNPDYIEEKWSEKYKRSIDCSNPRGFSQRAHCAGRKK